MDTRYPFVTCVMPTRNRREHVARSVAMFLNQDYPGRSELLVLEDGEQDCFGLVECLYPKVRYARVEGSIGAKLNHAVTFTLGRQIILRWDDDDWQAPNRISAQVRHMQMTGKSFVALSSALYYTEGDEVAYEYTGDAYYASGFSHCYTREWALANPAPDASMCEDVEMVQWAHAQGVLSVISGLDIIVARNHAGNTSPRNFHDPKERAFLLSTVNWREVSYNRIAAIVGPRTQTKEK